jgi:valyl-tRNA synthetase
MTIDELQAKLLELMPDALFDEEFGTGEVMISTGLVVGPDGKLEAVNVLRES